MQSSTEKPAENTENQNSSQSEVNKVKTSQTIEDTDQNQKANKLQNLWEYEEILKILGFGKTQWILLLISGLLTITSMATQLSLGIIAISSKCEFDMSTGDMGVMMTARVVGIVFSTYIWGYLSDIWGRRFVLIWTMFFSNILQVFMMFVASAWQFNIINLLIGISIGGISGALYPYLGEFNIAKHRPIVINYSTMFVSVTNIYVPAVSWLVLSFDWSIFITDSFILKPWRLIIFFSLLPGFIGALWLLSFPESPKLLLAHNKHKEALEALNWISNNNKNLDLSEVLNVRIISLKPEELANPDMLKIGKGCSLLGKIWEGTKPMFYKPHGLNVILAVMVMFGLIFCSAGLQNWFSEIINRKTKSLESYQQVATLCRILEKPFTNNNRNITLEIGVEEKRICDDTIAIQTYIDTIIMGSAFLLGFSLQGALITPLGRKNILLFSSLVYVLCALLLHFVTNSMGIMILLCFLVLIPGLLVSVMCGAIVDLVPTYFRGKAVSLGLSFGRLGLILSSNLVAALLESHCSCLFIIISGTFLVCASLTYFLPI